MIRRFAVLTLFLLATVPAHAQETSSGRRGAPRVPGAGLLRLPRCRQDRYADRSRPLAHRHQAPSKQKPTAHMPKIALTDAETQALGAYLSSLR